MADQLSNDLASLRIQKEEAPPTNRGKWLVIAAIVLGLGAGLWVLTTTLSSRVFKTEVRATSIELVSPAQGSVDLTSTGYVVAQTSSQVAAKLPGRVASVAVKEGDTVKAGQVIVQLADAEQRVAEAGAKARMESARATLADLKNQLEREKKLLAGGASVPATVEDLQAKVNAQEAAARAAEADYDAAKVNLGYMTIAAPIDGRVVSKPVEVGEFVGPGTAPVVEISDFSTLKVETDVPEARLSKAKVGAPAEIVLDAFPDRRFRGEVTDIVPKVNRAKATVVVKVKFVDPTDGVLPEMAARVSFLSAPLDAASMKEPPKLYVPASAVTERSGSKVVFRIEDGRARMATVVLGDKFGNGFELKSGPSSGTRVVADPPSSLGDGDPVKEKVD